MAVSKAAGKYLDEAFSIPKNEGSHISSVHPEMAIFTDFGVGLKF